jgi:predicted CXXCH cytochrome family protein
MTGSVAMVERRGHLTDSDCGGCHLAGAATTDENATKLIAPQEVLCRNCHPNAVRASHVSGVVPRGLISAEYPTDWKGEVTCSSCHKVHGSGRGLLRGTKRGKALCESCHDPSFFRGMKDQGISIQRGHLAAGPTYGNLNLDAFSLQCIGCHDSHADGVGVTVTSKGVLRHSAGQVAHPVGRKYRDAARSGKFQPESSLAAKNIWLPDGMVGCISCHEGYKKEHGKLVVSNEKSKLCFQCHNF